MYEFLVTYNLFTFKYHRLVIRLYFQSRLRKIEYKPKSTSQLIDLQIINKHSSCYCICFSKKDQI